MSDKTSKKQSKKSTKDNGKDTPVIDVTRKIDHKDQLILCLQAGGRCEFDACNKYLFEHHLTHKRFNFAQMAHIVAFSEKGPRGNDPNRPPDINNLDNLMLLCHPCHKQIDDFPETFSRETLENYKKAHEERIRWLTDTAPDRQTSVLILMSKIGGQTVKISSADIHEAVSPRYPASRNGRDVDLTKIPDGGDDFYSLAAREIHQQIEWFLSSGMEAEKTTHISLFALAPMPLLIYAGNLLSNKIPIDLFQKHRDTENWTWKTEGEFAKYKFHHLRKGTDSKKVALILSLSGKVGLECLPQEVINDASVYEITLDGATPNPNFLRQKQDLIAFKDVYQLALREIGAVHGKLEKLHLFPAVPRLIKTVLPVGSTGSK